MHLPEQRLITRLGDKKVKGPENEMNEREEVVSVLPED